VRVMGRGEDRFRAAAVGCLEAAQKTSDVSARATFLLMAQKWLELAVESPFGQRRFGALLDDFNEQQMYHRPKN